MQYFLKLSIKLFEYYKSLADKAIEHLKEEDFHYISAIGSNSVAVIMQHISGNILSRWTDIFTTDGEKPDRNRDAEFEDANLTKQQLLENWDFAWARLFETLTNISPNDYAKLLYIRNEGHTLQDAVGRQLAHYAYHIGQIVYISKMIIGEDFPALSIPQNASVAYNSEKFSKQKSGGHFLEGDHHP